MSYLAILYILSWALCQESRHWSLVGSLCFWVQSLTVGCSWGKGSGFPADQAVSPWENQKNKQTVLAGWGQALGLLSAQ